MARRKSNGNGNGNGHGGFTVVGLLDVPPVYPSLDAALQRSRFAVFNLVTTWIDHRVGQVATFATDFAAQQGRPPTPAEVAVGLDLLEGAAVFYLEKASSLLPDSTAIQAQDRELAPSSPL